jgi:hypothetical protein
MMHFLFNLLRIKVLCMFRALLAHPQEALHSGTWYIACVLCQLAAPGLEWYMNLETTRLRDRPRNRWQDEVREDGRIVGGEEWQEKVYNTEEWKQLPRTARNHHILLMPME